jgi:hypothetical protein
MGPRLAAFDGTWKDEALVVDKWLSVQATARTTDARAIRALMAHPVFDLKIPNRVYALIRGFCGANPRAFHAADGAGYALAADVISELQAMNPQVASRIGRSFDRWRQFDAGRQAQLAHDREEAELGVACIGAPIRDAEGKLVAGLSISAPADRHKPGWAEALRLATRRTGEAFGYTGDA